MLLSVMKTSLKSLLRSKGFWLMFFTMFIMQVFKGVQTHFGFVDISQMKTIHDFDPEFEYKIEHVLSLCNVHIEFDRLAVFTTAVSVFALKRDFDDKFFEIEKSHGLPTWKYCLGRMATTVGVIFAATYALNYVSFIAYNIRMGSLPIDMTFGKIVSTAIIGITENFIDDIIPILFFVTLTYMVAYLTSSPVMGSAGVMAYIIIYDVVIVRTRLKYDIIWDLVNYFPPRARAIKYAREGLDSFGATFYGITETQVMIAIGVLVLSYILFYTVTWLKAHRRID